jgi:amino acid transporter
MIGTGIFSKPSSITNSVGSVGAALCLWTLGLILAFCGLFVWLELACLHPVSGGEKVYLEAAFPKPRFLTTTLYAVYAIFLNPVGKSLPTHPASTPPA